MDVFVMLQSSMHAFACVMCMRTCRQVTEALTDMAFLNCRPSVIAAAVIYAERRARGIIPFWPSMLAKLSGYDNMSTPELSVAIKARAPGVPSPLHACMHAASGERPWLACVQGAFLHACGVWKAVVLACGSLHGA